MHKLFIVAILTLASAGYAHAQTTCGSVQSTDPGLDNASLWPNPACPGWQDASNACEAATESTYGGSGNNPVAEIDAEPRSLVQDVTLRNGHDYVLQWVASRRTNCTNIPNPVDVDITFTNTDLGTYTSTRSNTTFNLTAESTTLQASSTSGRLTIGPGSSFGSETCGMIMDDIELYHQTEDTSPFSLTLSATVGSPHSLTLSNLTYDGDTYQIQYTITRASGSPVYNCNTTGTPTSGSISWSSCQNAASGDTVEITAINNQGTVCNYPSTALPLLRDVVLFPSESKLAATDFHLGGRDATLRWRTDFELDTLGFHVYREVAGQRTRITPSLVAGSALHYAGGQDRNGRSYTWHDRLPEGLDPNEVRYLVEAVELDGSRRLVPAVRSTKALSPSFPAARARLLGERRVSTEAVAIKVPQIPTSVRRRVEARLGGTGMKLIAEPAVLSPQLGWTDLERKRSTTVCLQAPSAYQRRQWTLAASADALKLAVGRTGWHRVARGDLVAAGLDDQATAEELAMLRDGRPAAIRVLGTGRSFQAIEFFGVALDHPETGQAIYWLTRDAGLARRIQDAPAPVLGEIQRQDVDTVEVRERSLYFAAARRADGDNFFGPVVADEPVAIPIRVGAVVEKATMDARLDVEIHGISTGSHVIDVSFNQVKVGTLRFDGKRFQQATLAVPHEIVARGNNQVALQSQGGESDSSTLRLLRLTYQRRLMAESAALRATVAGDSPFAIEGLGSNAQLFDVTDPLSPKALTTIGNGKTLGSQAAAPGRRLVFAVTPAAHLSPLSIQRNRPSSWSQGRSAGLVIIGHHDLLTAANDLAQLRRDQGWRVEAADVDDLYDEFSFGHKSAQALRCFVEHSQRIWQRRPTHFLLLGDASFDPRDHLGLGAPDLMPTRFLPHREIGAPTDDWFLLDASLPSSIGRLPASSATDAQVMVDKLRAYDAHANRPASKRIVLVSDFDEESRFDFHKPLDELAEGLGSEWQAERIRISAADARTDARRAVIQAFNSGAGLIDYFGHGSVEIWSGTVMDADAVGELRGESYPFVFGMTCLNGLFTDLYSTSLAERLLARERGGAVGVLAASTRGYPTDHAVLNSALLTHLAERNSATLGEAVRVVKQRLADSSWLLLADPTLRLHGMHSELTEGEGDPRSGVLAAEEPSPLDPSPATASGSGGCAMVGTRAGSLFILLALLALARRRRGQVRS